MEKDIRADRFISKEGDLNFIEPQCRLCSNSNLDNGLYCNIHDNISLQIKLNKIKCEDFEKK